MGKKIKCSLTPWGRKSKDQGGERNKRSCNYIHPCKSKLGGNGRRKGKWNGLALAIR